MKRKLSRTEERKLPEWISYKRWRGERRMYIDDLPVKCGKKPREIDMESRDIQGANPKDPRNCALARACRRQFGGEAVIFGTRLFLRPAGADHWERMKMSDGMRVEAFTLDRGGRVAPGAHRAVPLSPAERERYEAGGRQGSNARGARDRGSRDRTPSADRPVPHYIPDVRHWAAAPKPRKVKARPAA